MKNTALAALLLVVLTANAEDGFTEKERFQFFNNCNKIGLETKTTVTQNNMVLINHEIRADIERVLHEHNIYDANPTTRSGFLRVGVAIHGPAFSIYIQFFKPVHDVASGINESSTVWLNGNFGTHTNDPEFILNPMMNLVKLFVADYKRINKESCKK